MENGFLSSLSDSTFRGYFVMLVVQLCEVVGSKVGDMFNSLDRKDLTEIYHL